MKGKTVKILGNNIGKYLCDFGVEKYFLNKTENTIKEKIGILDVDKIKSFCYQKTPLSEQKGTPQNRRIYLQCIELTNDS